jgi:uncharacterized protein
MLRFDVRAFRQGVVPTEGSLEPNDQAFEGLDLALVEPVRVSGTLQAASRGTYYWRGHVAGRVRGECRRCLTEVDTRFDVPAEAVFSTDPTATEDPAVYPLVEPVTHIDLTEVIREEVGLAAPLYPLCRDDCAGLCPRCGADLNLGPCDCARSPDAK